MNSTVINYTLWKCYYDVLHNVKNTFQIQNKESNKNCILFIYLFKDYIKYTITKWCIY